MLDGDLQLSEYKSNQSPIQQVKKELQEQMSLPLIADLKNTLTSGLSNGSADQFYEEAKPEIKQQTLSSMYAEK
jgi:hypothetical protein